MRLPETYQQQQRLYQQAREQIKNLPAGHAFTDIQFGFKRTDQQLTPRLAIRFQVKKKKQPKELRRSEAVPKKWQGFETDVVDFRIKPQTRTVYPGEEVRPLLGGLQVQSCLFQQRINWGTLGYCFRLQGQPAAGRFRGGACGLIVVGRRISFERYEVGRCREWVFSRGGDARKDGCWYFYLRL